MANFFVTNTNDSGAGSLRQALADAEEVNNAGHDQIIFDAAISGQTIRLTSGALEITSGSVYVNGDIDGNGSIDITISGDATGDGRSTDDSALLNVSSGATAILDSLSLTGGYVRSADASNGDSASSVHVISSFGTLTIANSVLANNYAKGGDGSDAPSIGSIGGTGGNAAIIATGAGSNTFVTDTIFTNNLAIGGDGGNGDNAFAGDGYAGGRGGDAALIVSGGDFELRNSISYYNTLDAGTGGNGGNSSGFMYTYAGNGGGGGDPGPYHQQIGHPFRCVGCDF